MAIALISDLHSNIEAIDMVLKDIESQGIKDVYCLGDFIGYGPNPREAILRASNFKVCLRGNHEDAVLFNAADFNEKAKRAVEWTKNQLSSREYDRKDNYILWDFLDRLLEKHPEGDTLYIHASPRFPTREYVLPRDVSDKEKMDDIFSRLDRLCFAGHTHIPGVFSQDYKFKDIDSLNHKFDIPEEGKFFINIGSVGQPRDGDNRSCYLVRDGNRLEWRRLEYPFRETMKKIFAIDALPNYLAERLEVGR